MNTSWSIAFCMLLALCAAHSICQSERMGTLNAGAVHPDDVKTQVQFRRPVSVVAIDSGWVVVGNRDSGTLSLVDPESRQVESEYKVVDGLGGMCRVRGDLVVVSERGSGQLVGLRLADGKAARVWTADCVADVDSLVVSPDGSMLCGSGRWARQVHFLPLDPQGEPKAGPRRTIDLDFNPGPVIWLDEHRVLVAGAFGNQVALLDAVREEILLSFEMAGHRTGGLALSADGQWIAFSDQRLNPLARSTRNDVHWGLMVDNSVRWLEVSCLDQLNTDDPEFEKRVAKSFVRRPVGEPGDAKADPGAIVATAQGEFVVAVQGVDQIAIGGRDKIGFGFADVGRRPSAVALLDGHAWVANELDDSLSIVNLETLDTVAEVSLGERPDESLVRRGERLFTDARLSHDGWLSCHSCHVDGHTNGLRNDNRSDQSFGAPKRVLSLLGHGQTAPFAWNGSSDSIEDQVRFSIQSTMQSDEEPQDDQVQAISAFVSSLAAPPTIAQSRGLPMDDASVARGRSVFQQRGCAECHIAPLYTSADLFDVGLNDENGEKKFNPPSLIGVGQRDSFFHDGRARELREVFTKIRHPMTKTIPEEELSDLIVFLKSL